MSFLSKYHVKNSSISYWLMNFVGAMADTESTCKNLSNSHICYKWRTWGPTRVAKELQNLGLSRYPTDLSSQCVTVNM